MSTEGGYDEFYNRSIHWWLEQISTNLQWNATMSDYTDLYQLQKGSPFTGKPVLIVDKGPSLEKNIALIKEFGGPVVCCDRALKPVIMAGAKPEYVVNVDSSYLCIPFLINDVVRPKVWSITAIFSVTSHSLLVYMWRGRRRFFIPYLEDGMVEVLQDMFPETMPTIRCRGNVLTTSHIIADSLGATEVVLVGCDNGYLDPEGLEHKTLEAKEIDVMGRMVWTDDVYEMYSALHLDLIADYHEQGKKVFNCTGGGTIYSEHVIEMEFEDYLKKEGFL